MKLDRKTTTGPFRQDKAAADADLLEAQKAPTREMMRTILMEMKTGQGAAEKAESVGNVGDGMSASGSDGQGCSVVAVNSVSNVSKGSEPPPSKRSRQKSHARMHDTDTPTQGQCECSILLLVYKVSSSPTREWWGVGGTDFWHFKVVRRRRTW